METTAPRHLTIVADLPATTMCAEHRAYEADYCPLCGTTVLIGERA